MRKRFEFKDVCLSSLAYSIWYFGKDGKVYYVNTLINSLDFYKGIIWLEINAETEKIIKDSVRNFTVGIASTNILELSKPIYNRSENEIKSIYQANNALVAPIIKEYPFTLGCGFAMDIPETNQFFAHIYSVSVDEIY